MPSAWTPDRPLQPSQRPPRPAPPAKRPAPARPSGASRSASPQANASATPTGRPVRIMSSARPPPLRSRAWTAGCAWAPSAPARPGRRGSWWRRGGGRSPRGGSRPRQHCDAPPSASTALRRSGRLITATVTGPRRSTGTCPSSPPLPARPERVAQRPAPAARPPRLARRLGGERGAVAHAPRLLASERGRDAGHVAAAHERHEPARPDPGRPRSRPRRPRPGHPRFVPPPPSSRRGRRRARSGAPARCAGPARRPAGDGAARSGPVLPPRTAGQAVAASARAEPEHGMVRATIGAIGIGATLINAASSRSRCPP